MSQTKKVAERLRADPGSSFCDDCLAGRLDIGQLDLTETLKAGRQVPGQISPGAR
jgi:hypothetical protein